MAVIQHVPRGTPVAPERAARADLRAQIARLERELAHLTTATYPRLHAKTDASAARHRDGAPTPRVLDLGALEQARDELAGHVSALRAAAAAQAERQAVAREELARMLADPPAHRRRRLTNADLGLPGCATYEVCPRFGLLGMLADWWYIKISSGCPLP